MNYSKSYQNSSSLAESIRAAAATGKTYKSGGLAARLSDNYSKTDANDFASIQAKYFNQIQDVFSTFETKAAEYKSLNFGLPPAEQAPTKASDYSLGQPDTFLGKLTLAESSGNPNAVHVTKEGEVYGGLLQIGQARLTDYNKATGSNVEMADMIQNVDIQKQIIDWHIADLTSLAETLAPKYGMSVNGLVAVGHLGGRTGMMKFAEGGYNPSDELGTSLSDYYARFK